MKGLRLPVGNPVWARQWQAFRSNRRGYWSLWIFLFLFIASLGAELIANDKPLLVRYDGDWYTPVFHTYPETTFGGFFESEANYRDPVVKELIEDKGWMLWPPIRYSYNTINYDLDVPAPAPPSSDNWLGTDDQGRDIVAGLIYGFRISVLFGLMLTLLSSLVGIVVGALQGYYGGWLDLSGQRFLEIWSSMPTLFLIIILSSFVSPSFWTLLVIMLLFSWMALVDLVRAEFLRCRNMDYVRAAHAMGVRTPVIMFRHMLPNCHGRHPHLPALHSQRRGGDTDFAGFHRLRTAAGCAVAGQADGSGQGQPARPLDRYQRLCHAHCHADLAGLYRRSRA